MFPRLSLAQHLGLYTTFHQATGNRRMHGVFTPLVVFSGVVLMAYAAPTPGSLLHAGTLGTVVLTLAFAQLDLGLALSLGAALLGMSAVGGVLVASVPAVVLVPSMLGLHALSWYFVVVVGHLRLEPTLTTTQGTVDSNEYFRRKLFLAQNTGVRVTAMDAFLQFSISPLAEVVELFEVLGLRQDLTRAIAVQRERVVGGLSTGVPFFDASGDSETSDAVAAPHTRRHRFIGELA